MKLIDVERKSNEIGKRYSSLFAEMGMPMGAEWMLGLKSASEAHREHMTSPCGSCGQQMRLIAEGRQWMISDGLIEDAKTLTGNVKGLWQVIGIVGRQQVMTTADRMVLDAVDAALDVRSVSISSSRDMMEMCAVLSSATLRACEAWCMWLLLEDIGAASASTMLFREKGWRKHIDDGYAMCKDYAGACVRSEEMVKVKQAWMARPLTKAMIQAESHPMMIEAFR